MRSGVRRMYIPVHSTKRAHPARAPAGLSCAHSPRLTGPRLGGILPQKQQPHSCDVGSLTSQSRDGRVSNTLSGAVSGAEHRSHGRKWPEGARRWIAAPAQQYTDVLSAQPGRGEKRRGERGFDARCDETHLAPASARTGMCGPDHAPWKAAWIRTRCESDHRVRRLAFLVTFWAMPKSNRLARRARRTLCTSRENKSQGAGFRLSPE